MGRRASAVSNGWRLVKHSVLTPVLDLIFPPVCVGCGRVGTLLCDRCIASFVAPEETGPPPYPLTALHALGQFNGALQKAVHALKYDCLTDLASPLGSLMAQAVLAAGWPRSQIIPVPLHDARYHQRGFNQSALLGQAIARQTGWGQWDEVLARVRMTQSQVGLNYQERQANVRGAFAVSNPSRLQGQDIILVDDVFTTGATLLECAKTLLDAGAGSIRALVVGRAVATDQR